MDKFLGKIMKVMLFLVQLPLATTVYLRSYEVFSLLCARVGEVAECIKLPALLAKLVIEQPLLFGLVVVTVLGDAGYTLYKLKVRFKPSVAIIID